ncbi:hypothetical protein D0B54_02375 [Solimonas sp. K1W22B-7]|uniref:hypothetical protein n=1 Tax=Solimonas sp. K1W22B-7 TaxID=2303331 RepID=UPI000E3301E5|nr:hypothetical protein [Solimonas sp. K1W22B-7]AXQ27587.1 hypothetical protein D0B54_02375 [Solimonas sp. K1W22B-7]
MSITLNTLGLPADLVWTDRYDWTPVVQSLARTEAGVLVREESLLQKGRPITLEGGDDHGWASGELVALLHALQLPANADPMLLVYHGQELQVAWRRDGAAPMSARPVRGAVSNPGAGELFVLALRFIEI